MIDYGKKSYEIIYYFDNDFDSGMEIVRVQDFEECLTIYTSAVQGKRFYEIVVSEVRPLLMYTEELGERILT